MPGDRPRTRAQLAGDAAEQVVAARLEAAGWRVLGRNVRVGRYELDLVTVDPGPPAALVIVEVRWRGRRDFGLPEESVDHRKRRRVRAGAFGLVARDAVRDGGPPLPMLPLRLDLVVVEPPLTVGGLPRIRHYRAVG